ncbi:MAG: Holliday junction branch migration protein RuvA [Armatimonadota bacterium]
MIAHLCGELKRVEANYLVVDVGGVGYKVNVPLCVMNCLPAVGERVSLFVSTVVRDDSISLYGFLDEHQQRMFELLIGVSGIGPRLALNILSLIPVEQIVRAISSDGFYELSRVPGIGTKTAQRIVLELKEKIACLAWAVGGDTPEYSEQIIIDDAVEGLVALGYSRSEARSAAQRALRSNLEGDRPVTRPSELITAALKLLSNS